MVAQPLADVGESGGAGAVNFAISGRCVLPIQFQILRKIVGNKEVQCAFLGCMTLFACSCESKVSYLDKKITDQISGKRIENFVADTDDRRVNEYFYSNHNWHSINAEMQNTYGKWFVRGGKICITEDNEWYNYYKNTECRTLSYSMHNDYAYISYPDKYYKELNIKIKISSIK